MVGNWRGPRSQEVGEEGDYTLAATTTMTPTLRLDWLSLFNAELSPKRYWR